MLVANVIQPGGGLHVDPASVDKNLISTFTTQAAQKHSFVDFLLGVVPANPVGPFLDNNILQILIIALTTRGVRSMPGWASIWLSISPGWRMTARWTAKPSRLRSSRRRWIKARSPGSKL